MSPFRRSDLFPRERVRDGFPLLYEAISLRSVDRSSHEFPGVSRACNCLSPILHLSRCVAIPDAGDIWLCIKPSERSRRKRSTSREIRDAVRTSFASISGGLCETEVGIYRFSRDYVEHKLVAEESRLLFAQSCRLVTVAPLPRGSNWPRCGFNVNILDGLDIRTADFRTDEKKKV